MGGFRSDRGRIEFDGQLHRLPPRESPAVLRAEIPENLPGQTHLTLAGSEGVRARAAGYTIDDEDGEGCGVPQQAWSEKRERQYEHIKEGLRARGRSEDTAEEIAARTVNKERARAGEARTPSRTSTEDISSGRRGGLRSHTGPGGRTFRQLYEEAKDRGIDGRSKMSKAQLERVLERR